MQFPPDVAERALLDSGRHCCLCHKFCGVKMELHHIVAVAEGGDDTYDNCIPLCLDCHAEVRAYDPKHPKGKKYTASELKGHRDRWYEKISKSHATTTNPDHANIDKQLFIQIRTILPSTGSIEFVRDHDYGGLFPIGAHNDLYNFRSYAKRPECEFMDSDLEGLRARLTEEIGRFLDRIGQYTFVLETRPNFCRVEPNEHDFERAGLFEERRQELNDLADRISHTYREFVQMGRRKLAVWR